MIDNAGVYGRSMGGRCREGEVLCQRTLLAVMEHFILGELLFYFQDTERLGISR
jgi:hypothetical protein